MPPKAESPPEPSRARGPEPLRRKRIQPVPSSNAGRRRALNLLLVFITVVVLVDAVVGEKGLMERMRARREYTQSAATLNALRHENTRMREEIQRLRSDPDAIEALAREELGYIKPGEILFIIRDTKPAAPANR